MPIALALPGGKEQNKDEVDSILTSCQEMLAKAVVPNDPCSESRPHHE